MPLTPSLLLHVHTHTFTIALYYIYKYSIQLPNTTYLESALLPHSTTNSCRICAVFHHPLDSVVISMHLPSLPSPSPKGLVSRGTSGHSPPPSAAVAAHITAAAHSEPNSPRNSRPGSPQKILPTARSSGNLLMPSISDERSRRLSDSGTSDLPPPFIGKGKHKCPRCYRRFEAKSELDNHKMRCLV